MTDAIKDKSASNGGKIETTGRTTPATSGQGPQAPVAPSPELMAKIEELRSKIQQSIGQVILAVIDLPRYKHLSLADVQSVFIHPLLRNRVAIAHKSVMEDGKAVGEEDAIAGIAIWASVSPEVDAKIAEQVKAGVFPVRLTPEEWTSGEQPWLLDVIAGDRHQATAVLANFRQLSGERLIKIHPMVGRLIDPSVLEKLRLASAEHEAPKTEVTLDKTVGNA